MRYEEQFKARIKDSKKPRVVQITKPNRVETKNEDSKGIANLLIENETYRYSSIHNQEKNPCNSSVSRETLDRKGSASKSAPLPVLAGSGGKPHCAQQSEAG
ncbi:MAG: hypothetical protein ORO03_06455, partial [Alphaproteobacteria bacterium]|nr:hypothetical protein [Alphaproteobacteria bacterium]